MKFTPEFDDEVYVGFGDRLQRLNPRMFATPLSAHQLAEQLADLKPVVVMDWPYPMAIGSPFWLSKKVPFLVFPSGYRENAGALQMWWVRVPEPDGLALRYSKAQIAVDEAQWVMEHSAAAEQ